MTIALRSQAIAIEKLAHLVALSKTFQAGRSWQDALEQSVLWWGRETDSDASDKRLPERPFAVIESAGGRRFEDNGGGSQNHYVQSGRLWLYMEKAWNPDFYDSEHDATNDASDYFDGVIEDVAALCGLDVSGKIGRAFSDESGDLNVPLIEQGEINHTDPDVFDRPDWFFWTDFELQWGTNPV